MNNAFSFSRFWHLVRIQLRETNLFWILAACMFTALIIGLYAINDAKTVEQLYLFILNEYWLIVFCIAGFCWTHTALQRYVAPGRNSLSYMLPATQGEKFAAVWFLSTIVYSVVALAVATLAWGVLQLPSKYVPIPWSVFTIEWHELFCFMLPVQALQILCGAWARRSLNKYYLPGVLVIFGAMYLYVDVLYRVLEPIAGCDVTVFSRIYFLNHSTGMSYDLWAVDEWSSFVIVATCYAAALFKFRERNAL